MTELQEKSTAFHFVSIPTTTEEKAARKTKSSRLPETLQSEAFDV